MTFEQFFRQCRSLGIPLADIKTVCNGFLSLPFDRIGIDGDKEIDEAKALYALSKLKDDYPANYLAGYIDVLDLHLLLNESTLIPRNETADFLSRYVKDNTYFDNKKILDLCTGSGFMAIAAKKYHPSSIIDASDISIEALTIAKKNATINNTEIKFIKSDFLDDIIDSYDIIICNPPYIREDDEDVYAPYEPKIALYSGKDGLDSYKKIFSNLDKVLNSNGLACFELESTNATAIIDLLQSLYKAEHKYEIFLDSYNRNRYLIIHSI